MKLRAIIADDELPGRENLNAIISAYIPDVDVVGMAPSVSEAKEKIRALRPDLVFLDIEMGDESGFDIIENIDIPELFVVFVTAYSSYAAQAFRTDAIDYILKPIDVEDLIQAVQKVKIRKEYQLLKMAHEGQLSPEETGRPELVKVVTAEGNEYIPCDKIVLMMSINYLTKIVIEDGRELVAGRHLKEFETLLQHCQFIRVHNSYLVNSAFVYSLKEGDALFLVMKNGHEIPVSRRRKDTILRILGFRK